MIKSPKPNPRFWETTPLEQMSKEQWESLCDGCGKCCLHKLEDEQTNEVFYTNISCKLLDTATCKCKNYDARLEVVPDCTVLSPATIDQFEWLPKTCAYRLISKGEALYKWHPLISGKKLSTVKKGKSVSGYAISDELVEPDDYEDHIIQWVDM